jgi:hypothetical protein
MEPLQETESLNAAEARMKSKQMEKLAELHTALKNAYAAATIELDNAKFDIDINNYLIQNKDKTYVGVRAEINKKIGDFCTENSIYKLNYLPSAADGRRKFKRSRSKKSIKSKRKY